MSKQQQKPTTEPEYEISEINLVAPLTNGVRYFVQGKGYTVTECGAARGGYWIVDHRGPKWWVPGTNVLSCKYDIKKPSEIEKRSDLAQDIA